MEDWKSFEELYNSLEKCKLGKTWKASVGRYMIHSMEELAILQKKLRNGKYKPRKPHLFNLTYPKHRECSSINIADRVIQRSLNDNIIYPTITKSLIWENMACQKGKGTLKAMQLLEKQLHRYYINNKTNEGYILQVDIKGYYKHIQKQDALKILRTRFDNELIDMIEEWWKIQHPNEIGFEPGDQLTQLIGISLLNTMDHTIKEKMRAKYYGRYMDDFYIISNDIDFLNECKQAIINCLKDVHLEIHPNKTKIYKISKGIKFLGFIFYLKTRGKVIKIIDPQNVKHERKKLFKMAQLVKKKEMSVKKFYECYHSWLAHVNNGNSYLIISKMNKYVKELLKEEKECKQ